MESVPTRASEEPQMRLDNPEEATEDAATERPLQVLSNKVTLLVPEFLNTVQAKEKTFVPVVSNTLHLPSERSQVLQQGSDLPKFSANPPQSVQGTVSKTTAKTVPPKQGNVPKSPADPVQPKQGSAPKLLAKAMQLKHRNTPKSSAISPESQQGSSVKTSEKSTQSKKGDSPKSLDEAIQARVGTVPKSLNVAIQARVGKAPKTLNEVMQPRVDSVPKSAEETMQPRAGSVPKPSEETIQPRAGSVPKPSEETIQPRAGSVPKSAEETMQPRAGSVPKSAEETMQPRAGSVPKSSEETMQPKEDDVPMSPEEQPILLVEGETLELEEQAQELLDVDLVKEILSPEDFREALTTAGEQLVAVEFSAMWCGPCRGIRPLFHALALKHKDVLFLEVDIDICEELVKECEVFSLPTFQFYKKAEKVGEFSGALIERLEAAIAELK